MKILSTLLLFSTVVVAAPSASLNYEYIVKLKVSDNGLTKREPHDLSWAEDIVKKYIPNSFVDSNEKWTTKSNTPKLFFKYSFGQFEGFAVKAPKEAINEFKNDPRVEYVTRDRKLKLFADEEIVQTNPTWGINRVDQRNLPLDNTYSYAPNAGKGITVYVVDTGLDNTHPEFEGRARWGGSFVNGVESSDVSDFHGHGTHCAGTIASKTYGIAKKAEIVSLKVFDRNGGGDSGVIAALNWISKNATPGKSVVSMSLGTDLANCVDVETDPSQEVCNNQAMKDAVAAVATTLNIPVAVAAGNDATDACKVAPASEPLAYTVGSSTKTDNLSSFSNYGRCVDIIAPGSSITSTWKNGGISTISGTSMATPHVAGAFALLLSQQSFSKVQDAYDAMTNLSTANVVKNLPSNTFNRLLYI
ncbi:hypothetical protein HK099_007192 [Clydaea vesicula]|uniref:Uncharacterized protein n=1 Tax=Clydaea vesicula TaxID=447962 RepID=A0AAD5TZ21_9FUNG|nr:hypothetical protein HK099_007192 [Clydaea vesicula]KAJ3384868.1 hypothetical protein HDU92_003341 [Lobulomyces angularis]